MALAIMFIGVPLIIYLFLVIAPAGRASRLMIGVIGLIVLYIWAGYMMSWEPLWTGNDRADAYTFAAGVIYSIAFFSIAFFAGAMTAIYGRRFATYYPSLTYPVIAVLILLITLVPLFLLVGL